jgi:hypothetical protein
VTNHASENSDNIIGLALHQRAEKILSLVLAASEPI